MNRRTFSWIAAALFGVLIAIAIGHWASNLAGQRIGLDAEPISVASGLAPKSHPQRGRPRSASGARAPRQASNSPAALPVAPPPSAAVSSAPAAPPPAALPPHTSTQSAATVPPQPSPPSSASSMHSHQGDQSGGSGDSSGGRDD